MLVEQELASIAPQRETLLSIGVFDGVHAGHRYLLETLRMRAVERSLLSAVVTFNPHPQSVLRPYNQMPWLSDVEDRVESIRGLGIDLVVVVTFTPELARLRAREFISLVAKHLQMRGIIVGPDFALGQGREGSIQMLHALGRELNFSVETVPPYKINGEVVSSTLIRRALAEGDTRKIHRLLGHYFCVRGRVVTSDRRGRALGFPTANLDMKPQQALPNNGIYATIACIEGRKFASATSIGTRPTFGGGKKTVETYLLNYQGDLYGRELHVEFVERLRDEQQFLSADELKKQIEKDVRDVETILAGDSE
jgi:riboflavin kinase / FMN adenylyltransferase